MARKNVDESMPPVDRAHMIAEAAYYKAVRRGFAPGHELSDWLEAEADIEAMAAPAAARSRPSRARKSKEASARTLDG